jgi:hypothetical protein
MKTRREYIVRERRVDDYYYTVEAKSKADAIRQVEECEVCHGGDVQGYDSYKPVVERIQDYDECPNKGEGWSDIPLDDLKDMKIGAFKWHYNGRCNVEKRAEDKHCGNCRGAMTSGKRLLTLEEKVYLKKTYGENRGLNTGDESPPPVEERHCHRSQEVTE